MLVHTVSLLVPILTIPVLGLPAKVWNSLARKWAYLVQELLNQQTRPRKFLFGFYSSTTRDRYTGLYV
jgi:hypothetical protein